MKIQDAVFEKCKCCNSGGRMISDTIFGCDYCKKVLDRELKNGEIDFLQLHLMPENGPSKYFEYCSWECLFLDLKRLSRGRKNGDVIFFPYLTFGKQVNGLRSKDFWKAIRAA